MTLSQGDDSVIVLVVEDEPLIRMSAVDLVESAGFTAFEAANADEAVDIISSSNIRIIFTDIDMPGTMDGMQLIVWARQGWPAIEIIVASGRHAMCDDDLPERCRFFAKPYDEQQITKTLHLMAAA